MTSLSLVQVRGGRHGLHPLLHVLQTRVTFSPCSPVLSLDLASHSHQLCPVTECDPPARLARVGGSTPTPCSSLPCTRAHSNRAPQEPGANGVVPAGSHGRRTTPLDPAAQPRSPSTRSLALPAAPRTRTDTDTPLPNARTTHTAPLSPPQLGGHPPLPPHHDDPHHPLARPHTPRTTPCQPRTPLRRLPLAPSTPRISRTRPLRPPLVDQGVPQPAQRRPPFAVVPAAVSRSDRALPAHRRLADDALAAGPRTAAQPLRGLRAVASARRAPDTGRASSRVRRLGTTAAPRRARHRCCIAAPPVAGRARAGSRASASRPAPLVSRNATEQIH